MRIHHIGYLVKKIDKAKKVFTTLGFQTNTAPVYDPYRKITICFMEKDGYRVELVSPASTDSIVSGLINKYRNTPYHLCYSTVDFDSKLKTLAQEGFTQIGEPCIAPAIDNRRVVFLFNSAIGLIELLEE